MILIFAVINFNEIMQANIKISIANNLEFINYFQINIAILLIIT